jgi:hypothetical protein
MVYALLGAIAVIVVMFAAHRFAQANPAQLAPFLRRTAGGACLALGVFLTLRGALPAAVPLILLGLALLGFAGPLSSLGFPVRSKTPGQRSTVRTSVLSMELDHDSGAMEGEVLAGPFAGRRLGELDLQSLLKLLDLCRSAGDQSEALLEAYLDRLHPDWRKSRPGSDPGGGRERAQASGGPMMPEEAMAILGLGPNATPDDVRAAHRRLMKLYHPDHGGSDYLAAKVNQAKAVMLAKLEGGRR